MKPLGVDTSLAVPLLLRNHQAHAAVSEWWRGRPLALAGHALAETYSVLTRLPAPLRLLPVDAARLLSERFARPLTLDPRGAEDFPLMLARKGIFGGATYDALVALAAVEHDAELATRDERARRTYDAVGARVVVVAA